MSRTIRSRNIMMRSGPERGVVTAELAVALPAVTVVLAAVLSMAQVGLAQVACVDAARAAARAAARGDGASAVTGLATDGAQSGASDLSVRDGVGVAVDRRGDLVQVRVSRSLRLLLPFGPRVQVSATAVSQSEQPADGDDAGGATVLVLGVCLVALTLVLALSGLVGTVVARHRAQSAADLGALAAADVLVGRAGGAPCPAARRVVDAHEARLVRCQVTGQVVEVAVQVPVPRLTAPLGPALARSRAGPASEVPDGW